MSRPRILLPPQITRRCDGCDKLFQPYMRDIRDDPRCGRFCSRHCSAKYKHHPKLVEWVTIPCSMCGKKVEKAKSWTLTKSGFQFCSRKCKDLAQRIESGIFKIHRYGTGEFSYREIAFRTYPKKCVRCGYDEYECSLRIHHKDRNRSNNCVSNLEVLCANCHDVVHFLAGDGRYCKKMVDPVGIEPT